jgi:hypothetical protein
LVQEFDMKLWIWSIHWSLYARYIHSFKSGSTALVRPLAASYGSFCNLFRHSVGLLLISDQPTAKASTNSGQNNTERRGQTSMP